MSNPTFQPNDNGNYRRRSRATGGGRGGGGGGAMTSTDRDQLPRDPATLLYRWTPPALHPDVLDAIGTPLEYAVFALPDTAGATRGGCIIFGWYARGDGGEWMANVPARALVMHLLGKAAPPQPGAAAGKGAGAK